MSNDDARAQIQLRNRDFMTAFGRGDSTAIAALYTADAQLLPANSDFVQGTDAIRDFWKAVLDSGLKEASLETSEVDAHGDISIEIGRYKLTGAAGSVADEGKYLVVWKKDDGSWKLHRDIWTTSQPAHAAV